MLFVALWVIDFQTEQLMPLLCFNFTICIFEAGFIKDKSDLIIEIV